MKAADKVKLIGIPPGLRDDEAMQTLTLFRRCLGQTFVIREIEPVEGETHQTRELAVLDVGHVLGKEPWEHTIWVEPEYLELVGE